MAEILTRSAELPFIYLISAFIAMEPVGFLISLAKESGGGYISEEVQRFIWHHCFAQSGEKIHQPYLQFFLKKLIIEVESSGGSVVDEFYQKYAYYMASSKDEIPSKGDLWIVKRISFLFPDGMKKLVIPLQCSLNMLGGDTGCSLWPSSLFLSEFILSFPEIFASRSCFEVGSGVGLVGICLHHVEASKVVMSDGDISTLANLKLNLEMNRISETDISIDQAGKDISEVTCIHLPWDSAKESQLEALMPEIILGADVIYDPSCLAHLVRVLSILLRQRKPSTGSVTADRRSSGGGAGGSLSLVLGRCLNRDMENGSDVSVANTYSLEDTISEEHASPPVDSLRRALNFGAVAFIATVIRNINTFNYFVSLASGACLTVRDLTETIEPARLLPYMQSYDWSSARLLVIYCNLE